MPSPVSVVLADPPTDREVALQTFVRALEGVVADLARDAPLELARRLVGAVRVLPVHLDPSMLGTVRRLATETFIRLCHQGGWHCAELELRCDVGVCQSAEDLADLLVRTVQISRDSTSGESGRLDSRIVRAIAYIRANCTRPSLVVDDVARHVGLSRWHLARLLVRSLGASYRGLVRSARMEEAERLLLDDGLSVKEVAVRLGYPHATELDRVFKQHAGVTPTEWRMQHRQGQLPWAQKSQWP